MFFDRELFLLCVVALTLLFLVFLSWLGVFAAWSCTSFCSFSFLFIPCLTALSLQHLEPVACAGIVEFAVPLQLQFHLLVVGLCCLVASSWLLGGACLSAVASFPRRLLFLPCVGLWFYCEEFWWKSTSSDLLSWFWNFHRLLQATLLAQRLEIIEKYYNYTPDLRDFWPVWRSMWEPTSEPTSGWMWKMTHQPCVAQFERGVRAGKALMLLAIMLGACRQYRTLHAQHKPKQS
eukprot:g50962.t1